MNSCMGGVSLACPNEGPLGRANVCVGGLQVVGWLAGPVPHQGFGSWLGAGPTRRGCQSGLRAGWLAAAVRIITTGCSNHLVISQFWSLSFYIYRLRDCHVKHILRETLSIWFQEHRCDHTSYSWCAPSCWAGSTFFHIPLLFLIMGWESREAETITFISCLQTFKKLQILYIEIFFSKKKYWLGLFDNIGLLQNRYYVNTWWT